MGDLISRAEAKRLVALDATRGDHVSVLEQALAHTIIDLYERLDRAQEAYIEATNPGINMEEVRELRHYREAEAAGEVAEPYVPREVEVPQPFLGKGPEVRDPWGPARAAFDESAVETVTMAEAAADDVVIKRRIGRCQRCNVPMLEDVLHQCEQQDIDLHQERLREYGSGPNGIGYGPRHPLDMD